MRQVNLSTLYLILRFNANKTCLTLKLLHLAAIT
jgi:hypothetical protein